MAELATVHSLPSVPGDLPGLLQSFDRNLRGSGKSDRTREVYGASGTAFCDWLAAKGLRADRDQFNRDNVADFLADLTAAGRKPATVSIRHRSLRAFARWLIAEQEIERDPFATLSPPKVPVEAPPILEPVQIDAMLDACGNDFLGRRDAAIIVTLFDGGLRRAELLGLRVEDVEFDDANGRVILSVTGKGSKTRRPALGRVAYMELDRYKRARDKHPEAHRPEWWLGRRGLLNNSGLATMLRRRGQAAGIPFTVHPHAFRHAAAHHALNGGAREGDLMKQMGWTDSTMLQRYGARLAEERAQDAHSDHAPGDLLRPRRGR